MLLSSTNHQTVPCAESQCPKENRTNPPLSNHESADCKLPLHSHHIRQTPREMLAPLSDPIPPRELSEPPFQVHYSRSLRPVSWRPPNYRNYLSRFSIGNDPDVVDRIEHPGCSSSCRKRRTMMQGILNHGRHHSPILHLIQCMP